MITVRQSFLSEYITRCPLRAQHQYGVGVERVERPVPVFLFVGSCFHLSYAWAYQQQLSYPSTITPDMITDRLLQIWSRRQVAEGETPITDIDWGGKTEAQAKADAIALIDAYYSIYDRTEARLVEHPIQKTYPAEWVGRDQAVTVTSRLDLMTKTNWIIDLKTSAVGTRRNGTEYFYSYSDSQVQWLPQPYIHLALYEARPYRYHVVGKGNMPLTAEVNVIHNPAQVATWEKKALIPVLNEIAQGNFPARPGPWCTTCEFAKDKSVCGLLAS